MGVALIKTPHVCTKFSNKKKRKRKKFQLWEGEGFRKPRNSQNDPHGRSLLTCIKTECMLYGTSRRHEVGAETSRRKINDRV